MSWLSYVVSNVALASLLAVAAWAMQRRRHDAVARALCVLGLIKLLAPPLVSLPVYELPGKMACVLGVCGCGPHTPTSWLAAGALPWALAALWWAGAVASAWTTWRRWARFQSLTARAVPAPRRWQTLAGRLAAELRLGCPPEILVVPGRLPPLTVAGWRRARILLPEELIDRLSASQRKALLLHELVHIHRRDHLVRMLELAVRVVYWWLPLVGLIGRRLRACEEACCDAVVLSRLPRARRDYARLLLDVLEFAGSRSSVPQATAMSAAFDLERRLRAILDGPARTGRIRAAGMLVVIAACALLPCQLSLDVARPATPSPAPLAPTADAPISPTIKPNVEVRSPLCCSS